MMRPTLHMALRHCTIRPYSVAYASQIGIIFFQYNGTGFRDPLKPLHTIFP